MFQHIKLGALVAGAIALSAPVAKAETFINILTGGTSGVYYPLGVALSEVYGENMSDVRVQVQSTKASVENLNLLQQGRGELAFALGDSVKDAWEGNADAGFKLPVQHVSAFCRKHRNVLDWKRPVRMANPQGGRF